MYESPVKNFLWEELGTVTAENSQYSHISNPLFVLKETKSAYNTICRVIKGQWQQQKAKISIACISFWCRSCSIQAYTYIFLWSFCRKILLHYYSFLSLHQIWQSPGWWFIWWELQVNLYLITVYTIQCLLLLSLYLRSAHPTCCRILPSGKSFIEQPTNAPNISTWY